MPDIIFETLPYAKIILHAVKNPYSSVNGLLLANANSLKDINKVQELKIVDAVPMLHRNLHVSMLAEIALSQIDAAAQLSDHVIVGYYAACENVLDNTIDKCPAVKIADKIVEYFPSAIVAVVNNEELTCDLDKPGLRIYQHTDGKWKQKDNGFNFAKKHTLELMTDLKYACKYIIDFDDHLDDIKNDWSNKMIETLIQEKDTGSKPVTRV